MKISEPIWTNLPVLSDVWSSSADLAQTSRSWPDAAYVEQNWQTVADSHSMFATLGPTCYKSRQKPPKLGRLGQTRTKLVAFLESKGEWLSDVRRIGRCFAEIGPTLGQSGPPSANRQNWTADV